MSVSCSLVAFGHGEPVVSGCRAVVLRVPSVTGGGSPFGPVRAVFAFRVQHFGEVGVVATLLGRCVAGIGDGVTLVGGGQGCLGDVYSLGLGGLAFRHGALAFRHSGLAFRHGGLAAFQIGLVWLGVGLERVG